MELPKNYGHRFAHARRLCAEMNRSVALDLILDTTSVPWAKRATTLDADAAVMHGAFLVRTDDSFDWPVVCVHLVRNGITRTAMVYPDPHTDDVRWKMRLLTSANLPSRKLGAPAEVIPKNLLGSDDLRGILSPVSIPNMYAGNLLGNGVQADTSVVWA